MTNTFDRKIIYFILGTAELLWNFSITPKHGFDIYRFSSRKCVVTMCSAGNLWKTGIPQLWKPVRIFFLIFGGHQSFLWGHCFGRLVTSPLGFKARVGNLISAWQRCTCDMFSEIYLWCDTCQPLGSQHGSWVVLFHIPARHWWDLKPGAMMPPLTVWDQADALTYPVSAEASQILLIRSKQAEFTELYARWKSHPVKLSRPDISFLFMFERRKDVLLGNPFLFYVLLRSCGKVMFSQASVCSRGRGGGCHITIGHNALTVPAPYHP